MFSLSSKTISIFLMACSGTEATGHFQQKASPEHRLMKVGRGTKLSFGNPSLHMPTSIAEISYLEKIS